MAKLYRFLTLLPFVPRSMYCRLFDTYMEVEAERARAQALAAELLTENALLRRQLEAAQVHQKFFHETVEEILAHSERMVEAK